jgi:hypothetical protein
MRFRQRSMPWRNSATPLKMPKSSNKKKPLWQQSYDEARDQDEGRVGR